MAEVKEFQAESKELLNLMINSIYSNSEVFLRELISNASDAIDKERYNALNSNGNIKLKDKYEIRIELDKENKTISIIDDGVGMNKDDLIADLGTIARSGSKSFVEKFKEAKKEKDFDLIGQFGVGFYSAFIVASKIIVDSKKDNEQGFKFISNGEDTYTLEESNKSETGTKITLFLKEDSEDVKYSQFLNDYVIENLVSKYSDYIRYPIIMKVEQNVSTLDENGNEVEGKSETKLVDKTLNKMIPLWKKNKNDISEEEYNSFYKQKFNDYEDPLMHYYLNVEGMVSYNAILFIPSHVPYDFYQENYERGLDLYAKGVFIKDKCKDLIPDYLRFVKGVVDSSDLSLNISREMLQKNQNIRKIRDNIENKIIKSLKELKKDDFEKYSKFYDNFGEFLKYGIYYSYGAKTELLKDLLVFKTLNHEDKYISLEEYISSLKEGQNDIYFATGDSIEDIKILPQLQKLKKQGIDVLFLDKKVDEFVVTLLKEYDKHEFKSISDYKEDLNEEEKEKIDALTTKNKRILDDLKTCLEGKVSEVRLSNKLVDFPVCMVSKNGLSLNMEKVLNELPNSDGNVSSEKVLELNPDHEVFNKLKDITDMEIIKNYAIVLYNEALMVEGIEIKDKKEFTEALNKIIK